MPIITFWSNNEKAIGQSVSAATVATVMAIEHNYKVLLISMDFDNDVIENCFGAQESNKAIVKSLVRKPQINLDSGINGLLKLADSNRVTPDVIHDYTKIVFKNRLEVLYSPMNVDKTSKGKVMEAMKNIVFNSARYYDQVIVDLKKGISYNEQIELLNMSDVIVVNTDPNVNNIQKIFEIQEINKLQNKVVWNICKCDKYSKYNLKNLSRTILKKQAVYSTDYNTLLFEAAQEGALAELLIKIRTLRTEDENLDFFTKMKEFKEGILLKYQETRTIR